VTMSRQIKTALIVLVLVVGSGAAGWIAGQQIESAEEAAARAAPPEPSIITVPVELRPLESKLILRGVVRPADVQTVEFVPSSSGDTLPVVTGIRRDTGDTIQLGDVLIEVAERPVIALAGEVQVFRDMGLGTTGTDVMQLETSLAELGLDPGPIDGVFDDETLSATSALYDGVGFAPATELGGDQLVVPRSEVVFISGLPRVVDSMLVGYGVRIEGPVLTVSAAGLVVEASVLAADREFVAVGDNGWVVEDQLGLREPVTITKLATRTTGLADFASFAVVAETIDPGALDRDLVDISVRLEVPLTASEGEVLVVPVSALSSGPDGTARLRVWTEAGIQTVEVTAGLTAGGLVEVKPLETGALDAGDLVVVGEGR